MNEREIYGKWLNEFDLDNDRKPRPGEAWMACAESKQAELDSLRFEFERSVNEHETCKLYADGLNLELDKANKEIERCTESYKLAYIRAQENAKAYGIVRAELDKANARIDELTMKLIKYKNKE